jgi:preprotein translocase subunit YajC
MFATPAFAQATGALGGQGGPMGSIMSIAPLILLVVAFYFLLIRPQQQRAKKHAATIGAIKRGDTVVLTSGVIGKVVRVEDGELGIEIATGVTIKAVKSMVHEVRVKGSPAPANDAKS